MRKLLFFDIDGTILSEGEKRYVPDSAIRAIRELQANGHLCFINSGTRTKSSWLTPAKLTSATAWLWCASRSSWRTVWLPAKS